MTLIKKFLTPPIFEDEEKTHQAYLLHTILLALIAIPIPYVIYVLVEAPAESNRALAFILALEVVNAVSFTLLRYGRVRSASIVQITSIWLVFVLISITSSGIYGISYLLGNGLMIIISGILLGGPGAVAMTLLVIIEGGVMVYAEMHGWTPPDILDDALPTWIVSIVFFAMGATLQQLASRALRMALGRAKESEEKYRLISKVSTDYAFASDVDIHGNINLIWVAGAFEKMTGYTFEEYVAAGGWLAHVHPDDLKKDANDIKKLLNNEDVVNSDIRTYAKNGNICWERIFAHPVWDEKQNRLVGIIGAVQDVTEQKNVEDALRESESIYRQAIEVAGAVPYRQTFDNEGRIIYDFMGEGIRQITGYGPEEFNDDLWGLLVQERHLLEDLALFSLDEAIDHVRSGKKPIWKCEHRIKARDGKIHWVFEAAVDLRDDHGVAYGSIGMYQDITERKQVEDSLRYEQALLQIFMDNIPDTVYFKDTESRFVRINQAQAKLLNIDNPEFAIGKTDLDFQDSALAMNFMAEEKLILETGKAIFNRIEFNPSTDGKPRWFSATKVPVKDNLGSVTGIIGISRDITEQKLAEQIEQDRRIMLEKVVELSKHVTEASDLRTTIKKIWHGVHDDLDFDRLAIFLFNPERNSMDDTFGTDNQGQMIDVWDIWFPISEKIDEATTFMRVLNKPDGLYFTHDYSVVHQIPQGHDMYGVKDFAAAAVWAGNKPVAVICVDRFITMRPITPEQLEALRLFAGYAGLAIENARLHEKLQNELAQQTQAKEREEHRREILEKVVTLGQRVTEVFDLRATLIRIWQGVHDDLGFDRLGIYLHNPERSSMDGTFGTDHQGEMVDEWHTSISLKEIKPESISFLRVLEKPDTIYLTHTYQDEYKPPKGHIMSGVNDFAAVAAWAGEKPVAAICVDNVVTGRPISEEQLEALRLFAGYAGLAIENARLNSALQNELSQRKNFIVELEAKNAELERFTYTVSHDLKSPLVTIKGFLGYLEKDAHAGNFEKFKNDIHRIETAVGKMQNLLQDLLELSRIGRLMNSPSEIPFNDIVKAALEIVHGQLEAKNVLIEYQNNNVILNCDQVRMTEVMQNLLDNAIKFMGDQPKPRIEIGSFINDQKETIIYIKDNGIGIAPEFHEKIFGLFNKLSTESDGTGIGLSLVKRIIEVHGGHIWMESQVGKGATFYFTIPTSNR